MKDNDMDRTLRTGETMSVRTVVPPAGEYADKLTHFLDHKPEHICRKLKSQLEGRYADICSDKFFVGEVEGRLAGQLWYGYPAAGSGVANFGEVYTAPEFRGKGVVKELMKAFQDDFQSSQAVAALCTSGAEWIAKIYFDFGFQAVIPGTKYGPLILIKEGFGKSFEDFEKNYYKPGQSLRTELGSMKHRHDIDTVLRFSTILRRGAASGDSMPYAFQSGARLARRTCMSYQVPDYMKACFMAEDGKGILTVANLDAGKVAGWSFFLNTGSEDLETESKIFDYEIHPSYGESALRFIKDSLELAHEKGIREARACCPASFEEKAATLCDAGFKIEARLKEYCRIDGMATDLLIMSQNI